MGTEAAPHVPRRRQEELLGLIVNCTREICDNPADPKTGVCDKCNGLLTRAGYPPSGKCPINLKEGPSMFRGRRSTRPRSGGGMGQWPISGNVGGYDGHDDYNDGAHDDV